MTMSSYREDMAEYAGQWDEAKAGGTSLPEGIYQARIKVCRVERASFDPQPWQLFVVFEDMGGVGEQPMWYNLEHEVGASLAKRITRDLGWGQADDANALLELEDVCASGFFDDLVAEIRVKDKPGDERVFKQVFINKLLGRAEPTASSGAPASDDDIPF